MTNEHAKEGLQRPCTSHDMFLVRGGLQCGNCLAFFPDHEPAGAAPDHDTTPQK